jgi:triacylglycerol lipase
MNIRSLFPPLALSEIVGGEAIATLREVVLSPRDISPLLPHEVHAGDDVVVFVHGFFATAGVFRPMRAHLEEEAGAHVASFTHAPGMGVRAIAKRLSKLIDRIPRRARVHLVGHSLGGVVARWYVQELGGHDRVVQTISLGSPFAGTEHAKVFPFLIGKDLHSESAVLAKLRSSEYATRVPHMSIVAEDDRVVVPFHSAMFHIGEVVVMPGRGHNSLLFDDEVAEIVVDRIRNASKFTKVSA